MFKLNIPIVKSSEKNGKLIVEGIASDPTIDREEERFDAGAIVKMKDAVNKGGIPIRIEHENKIYTDVGIWKEADVIEGDKFYVKGEIDTELSLGKDIGILLKRGSLSLSVGGKVVDANYEYSKELGKNVKVYKDVILDEISVVRNPAHYTTSLTLCKSVDWDKVAKNKKMEYTTQAQQLTEIYKNMKKVSVADFMKSEDIKKTSIGSQIYNLYTKSMEKEPIVEKAKEDQSDSDFAYVEEDEDGKKTRKLPIDTAENVTASLAGVGKAGVPEDKLDAVKSKIDSAAKKFKVGEYAEKSVDVDKCGDSDKKKKWKDKYKGMTEEGKEALKKWYDDVATPIAAVGWDSCTSDPAPTAQLTSLDLKMVAQLVNIMSSVDLPSDMAYPEILMDENYWTNITEEMQIALYSREFTMPHHNTDLSLNKELILWHLKGLVDNQGYYTPKEYTALLGHLYKHLKELMIVKSVKPILTDAEFEIVKMAHDFKKGLVSEAPMLGGSPLTEEQIEKCAKVYEKLTNQKLYPVNKTSMDNKETSKVAEEVKKADEVTECPVGEELVDGKCVPKAEKSVAKAEETEEEKKKREEKEKADEEAKKSVAKTEETEEEKKKREEEEAKKKAEEAEKSVKEASELEEVEKRKKKHHEAPAPAPEVVAPAEEPVTPAPVEEPVAPVVEPEVVAPEAPVAPVEAPAPEAPEVAKSVKEDAPDFAKIEKSLEDKVEKSVLGKVEKALSEVTKTLDSLLGEKEKTDRMEKALGTLAEIVEKQNKLIDKVASQPLGRKSVATYQALEKSFKTSTEGLNFEQKLDEYCKTMTPVEAYKKVKEEMQQQ